MLPSPVFKLCIRPHSVPKDSLIIFHSHAIFRIRRFIFQTQNRFPRLLSQDCLNPFSHLFKITVITGVLQYMNHIHLPGTVLRVFIPDMPLNTCFFRIQKIVISYPLDKRVFRQLRHRHEAAGRSQRRRINMEIHIPVLH